ncbi:MAG: ATP-binding protein [Hyphomicrobiales bacterium]|nr:ATP-binding protein [Hyphomicrobiales bacterium]
MKERFATSISDEHVEAERVTGLNIIRDCLDAMLHPSVRYDALTSARHRAFMAPRLLGSLTAFAAFPLYLVVRGAPTALEVAAFAWLIAPILLSYFLSRTGRYESAQIMSSLAVAGLVMVVAIATGGIASFAALWLVVVPIEAALSASRRIVAVASSIALACVAVLVLLTAFDWLPASDAGASHTVLTAIGIASATLYAAGIAFSAESLSRTSVSLLNVEEDRYRLLARHMSDVISRHRPNGTVQFISPAAETLVGVPPQRLFGHGLFDRVHVADRPAYLTALSDAARGGEARSVEFRLRRDNARGDAGDFIWVEMRCQPLEIAPDRTAPANREAEVVAVLRDVTDRKLQQQALEEARNAAERADASKTRFLATMSHELRTPLNAIIGFSEMIAQEDVLMLNAAKRQEYARLINDSGLHLLSVVNGILDMSKLESGSFELAPEPFAPRPALINCCNLLALKASDNGVDLVTDVPKDLPEINGDPRAFRQILLNLVSNAIKFTDRGGSVTVTACTEAARVLVCVRDTGVGIAAADLARIGDPFFQAGETYHQRRKEGTGLGLSIVKSLVRMHGGEMQVQSRVGEGTTVTVALPLDFAPPQAEPSNITPLNLVSAASRPALSETIHQVKKSA